MEKNKIDTNNNNINNNNNKNVSPLSLSQFELSETDFKQQLEQTKKEKNNTEENIKSNKKEMKNLINNSINGFAVINKDEIIKQQELKIQKLQKRKKELKKKVADLEAKIELLQTNIEQLKYRIEKQNTKIKNQDQNIKNQGETIKNQGEIIKTQGDKFRTDIEQLKKQVDVLVAYNNNLKESIDSDRINAIQDAALIGEQVNLVTVCQYYLEHCVLKEINEDKEEKDKISWDTFKCNYTRNNEAKKIAKGVELDKVLELCRDTNMFVYVNNEVEIKKIINNIKIVYRALPTSDAKFRPYKKSLLRICRFITDDEEFKLN